jgi:hypothetical protein
LPIYTPNEAANLGPARNLGEAAAKGAINVICTSAPLLAGYGIATGNVPATAFGAGASIACNLPFIDVPFPPPVFTPVTGGQCPTAYVVVVQGMWERADGLRQVVQSAETSYPGPIGPLFEERRDAAATNYSLVVRFRDGAGNLWDALNVNGSSADPDNEVKWLFYEYVLLQRVDGLPDNCGNAPPVQSPLPPGFELPPGFPSAPRLPGGGGTVPYKDPRQDPVIPPRQIPFTIPPIALPPVVVVPIKPTLNAPITIPVSIPVSISPNVNITIPVQIGPSGEIRTPPDLICPCEYGEEDPSGAPDCPELIDIEVPYYSCDSGGEFLTTTLSVVRSTLPSDLLSDLLSSSNLAQIGCESIAPDQLPPARLESSRTPDFGSPPYYSVLLPEDVVSVELRITEFSPLEYREISTFPLGEQRKFGSMSYCIDGLDGGDNPTYIWDTSTYFRLPKRAKPGRLKILLRPSISFELWDTGERF